MVEGTVENNEIEEIKYVFNIVEDLNSSNILFLILIIIYAIVTVLIGAYIILQTENI